jgi:hypothetical protein
VTPQEVIDALGLPAAARVDQRVPKKLLIENGAPTAADRRLIEAGIESLTWCAALKPTTIGVPEYADEQREYVEIAVACLSLRDHARAGRLIELTHRAIQYPLLLVTSHITDLTVSLCHIRWSQAELGKTVLDGELILAALNDVLDPAILESYASSLAIVNQPRNSMLTLYQGWFDTTIALLAACQTGIYRRSESQEDAEDRLDAVRECRAIYSEMSTLRSAAKKERQIAKQVDMNLKMKQLEAKLKGAHDRL